MLTIQILLLQSLSGIRRACRVLPSFGAVLVCIGKPCFEDSFFGKSPPDVLSFLRVDNSDCLVREVLPPLFSFRLLVEWNLVFRDLAPLQLFVDLLSDAM